MSEPATQSAESQLEQRRSAASCAIAFAEFEGSTVSDEARAFFDSGVTRVISNAQCSAAIARLGAALAAP
jgi:hypothetical protein